MRCRRIYQAPMGHALVGVDGPAPKWAWVDGINYQQIKTGRIEAVKLMCAEDIDGTVVENVLAQGPGFIIARIYAPITSPQTGAEVMLELLPAIMRLYNAGIRYFEIANEPNLWNGAMDTHEGLGLAWMDGEGFGEWWLDAANFLLNHIPEARFGFPAMSPGAEIAGFRYPPDQFMREARKAVIAADWMAVHVYWENDNMEQALADLEAFALEHSQKLVILTEFGNASPFVPLDQKAAQYVEFYKRAKKLPRNIGALICFTLDIPAYPDWSWKDSNIASIVGSRPS